MLLFFFFCAVIITGAIFVLVAVFAVAIVAVVVDVAVALCSFPHVSFDLLFLNSMNKNSMLALSVPE